MRARRRGVRRFPSLDELRVDPLDAAPNPGFPFAVSTTLARMITPGQPRPRGCLAPYAGIVLLASASRAPARTTTTGVAARRTSLEEMAPSRIRRSGPQSPEPH